jgi:hypothetical protein
MIAFAAKTPPPAAWPLLNVAMHSSNAVLMNTKSDRQPGIADPKSFAE